MMSRKCHFRTTIHPCAHALPKKQVWFLVGWVGTSRFPRQLSTPLQRSGTPSTSKRSVLGRRGLALLFVCCCDACNNYKGSQRSKGCFVSERIGSGGFAIDELRICNIVGSDWQLPPGFDLRVDCMESLILILGHTREVGTSLGQLGLRKLKKPFRSANNLLYSTK